MVGRQLGRYRLVKQLAVGGMAEIYAASVAGREGFEKSLALKVIHPNYSADATFVQMLIDEAKLAVQLQHANIVQTFDLGHVDDLHYIAMELIEGADLYKVLQKTASTNRFIPFEVAAFVAAEVASGLDYAHNKKDGQGRPLQIVHRDMSPHNVLLSYAGEIKIVDFGIAKSAWRQRQTAAGVIKGKSYYMSPEQGSAERIDFSTDIFSTGILLYEMLIGEPMYAEENPARLAELVRRAEIPRATMRRTAVPSELDAIAMRALARQPADRWATAREMSLTLKGWLRANAPDFTATQVGLFIEELLGPLESPPAPAPSRSAAEATAEVLSGPLADEHSLIHSVGSSPLADALEAVATAPTILARPKGQSTAGELEATVVDAPAPREQANGGDEGASTVSVSIPPQRSPALPSHAHELATIAPPSVRPPAPGLQSGIETVLVPRAAPDHPTLLLSSTALGEAEATLPSGRSVSAAHPLDRWKNRGWWLVLFLIAATSIAGLALLALD